MDPAQSLPARRASGNGLSGRILRRFVNSLLVFYGAHLPYHRGKGRVVCKAIELFGLQRLFAGRAFAVDRRGLRWVLEPDCVIQRSIYYCSWFEIHDSKCLLRFVQPDWVFLDIGANIGYYSMLVARASHQRASIHAFEPAVQNFAALNRNRDLNGLSSIIHTYCTAVSGTVGEAGFRLPPSTNRGMGSLCPSPGSVQTGHRVKTTTIDHFAEEQGLDRVSCIKIDVEGAEALVLSGGTETIRRWQPILMIELNSATLAQFGSSGQSLVDTLRGLGYRLYYAPHGRLKPFEHLPAALSLLNLFCLPARTERGGR